MAFLGGLLQWFSDGALHILAATGYWGLFLLMAAESMILPVPSEAVMPFAGILVAQGKMTWWFALLAASAGSLAGSWLSYEIGARGLVPLVDRYGKYVLVRPHHLAAAHRWFERRGALAIFGARFVPVVRHLISLPAGAARMPMQPFLAATLAGATAWNAFLLYVGWKYGEAAIAQVGPYLDVVAVVVVLAVLGFIIRDWARGRKPLETAPPPGF